MTFYPTLLTKTSRAWLPKYPAHILRRFFMTHLIENGRLSVRRCVQMSKAMINTFKVCIKQIAINGHSAE
jgi:hypothetical protein